VLFAVLLLAVDPSSQPASAPAADVVAPSESARDAPRPPMNTLSLALFAPIAGVALSAITGQVVVPVTFEYERVLAPRWSIYGAPGFVAGTLFGKALGGLSLSVGARFFILGRAPAGLWIAPEVGVTWLVGFSAQAAIGTFGALAGYAFVLGRGFFLSLGAGAYFRVGTFGNGVIPMIRMNVGWAL
jgi:hypothetical protein